MHIYQIWMIDDSKYFHLFAVMNYLVAVLPDRIQAEAAYSALEKENLSIAQVTILGNGYQSDELPSRIYHTHS